MPHFTPLNIELTLQNTMRYPRILTASFACSLLVGSAFAQTTYTLNTAGSIQNADVWSSDGIDYTLSALTPSSADTFIIDGTSTATASAGSNFDLGGAKLNLSNGVAFNLGSQELTNMEVNLTGASTFLITNTNARINTGFVLNYDGSGISESTSSGNRFVMKGGEVNLNSGGISVETLTKSKSGSAFNLNGGDLLFENYEFGNSPKDDSINFTSLASTMTYTGSTIATSATDIAYFESLATSGFLNLNGAQVASTAFKYEFKDGIGLEISIIPEPGTYAVLAGFVILGSIILRRRR